MKHKYLICYDICDSKRLRKVHRTIRDLGVPIQFSIFELEIDNQQKLNLTASLKNIINETEDKITLYQINSQTKITHLGISRPTEDLFFL
jgi:CRISPR-associated protein Cas2